MTLYFHPFLLICLLCFVCATGNAQQTQPDTIVTPEWGFTWMPLSLLQLRPRHRLGVVFPRGRTALNVELEYNGSTQAITYGGDCPTGLPLVRFFGLQVEEQYYNKRKRYHGGFVAISGLINYSKSEINDLVYLEEEGYFDNAMRQDFRIALLGKIGHTWPLGPGGYLEFYTGLGGGVGKYSYQNFGPLISPQEAFAQCGHTGIRTPQTQLRPEFQLGLRLGIWKR